MDSIDLRNKANRADMLEKLVSSLEGSINQNKQEKMDLCGVISDLRQQLNESEDFRLKSKQDEKLAIEKVDILKEENGVLKIKIQNLEGAYQNEYGNIGSAFELNQKVKKMEVDLEFGKKENHKIEREKQDLVGVLHDLREQLNMAEEKIDQVEQERIADQRMFDYEKNQMESENEELKQKDSERNMQAMIEPDYVNTNYNTRRTDQGSIGAEGQAELIQELGILRDTVSFNLGVPEPYFLG